MVVNPFRLIRAGCTSLATGAAAVTSAGTTGLASLAQVPEETSLKLAAPGGAGAAPAPGQGLNALAINQGDSGEQRFGRDVQPALIGRHYIN